MKTHPGVFLCKTGGCRECIYAFRGGGIGDGGTDQSVPYESVANSRLSMSFDRAQRLPCVKGAGKNAVKTAFLTEGLSYF